MAWALATPVRTGAAEPLSLQDADGRSVAIAPSPDTAVVLHFWATWCPSCAEEFADLERALSVCPPGRVELYAVNVGDPEPEIRAFVREHEVGLPLLRDPRGAVWRQVDGRGLPVNLSWTWPDARETDVGPGSRERWQEWLAKVGCPAP
jgi:peroxiredoxin